MKKKNALKINCNRNFVFAIPLLLLILLMLSFSREEQVRTSKKLEEKKPGQQQTDFLQENFIYVDAEQFKFKPESSIRVLMNKNSRLMVDGEFATMEDVSKRVTDSFRSRIGQSADLTTLLKNPPQVKVVVQKDVATDQSAYEKMLGQVDVAINNVQDSYSSLLLGKTLASLSKEEKQKLDIVIEPHIYIVKPKVMKLKP